MSRDFSAAFHDGKRGVFFGKKGFVGAVDRDGVDGGERKIVGCGDEVAVVEDVYGFRFYAERGADDGRAFALRIGERFGFHIVIFGGIFCAFCAFRERSAVKRIDVAMKIDEDFCGLIRAACFVRQNGDGFFGGFTESVVG